jgi:hypothetical protein
MSIYAKLTTPNSTYAFQYVLEGRKTQYLIGIQEVIIKANTFTDEYQTYFLHCDQLKIENNFWIDGSTCKLLKSFAMTSGALKVGYFDNIMYRPLQNEDITQLTFSLKNVSGGDITLSKPIEIVFALKSLPLNE